MAVDSYMYFENYDNSYLQSETQTPIAASKDGLTAAFAAANNAHGLFEVEDYSFDIEQVLNIGSQSSGAGAGKVTFNPFSITRKIDVASPVLFQNACTGTPFKNVGLGLRKSAGGATSGVFFLVFTFKLVAVKTVSWAHDDESPKETVTFEYGGLAIQYVQQKPDGSFLPPVMRGWNRIRNIAADADTVVV
ncbi:MAG TPA: type VI secretion system tube protein Hcp [Micropepsaceae bacterium]|nr:type VI secretion system tube protein Hcp [Micropepsaceae bacterium]